MDKRIFKCFDCDHVWEVEFGMPRPSGCPKCESINIRREDGKGNRAYRRRRGQRSGNFGRNRF